jgi:hypothetical protein
MQQSIKKRPEGRFLMLDSELEAADPHICVSRVMRLAAR